jgi:hypothetical protein
MAGGSYQLWLVESIEYPVRLNMGGRVDFFDGGEVGDDAAGAAIGAGAISDWELRQWPSS